MKNTLLFCAMLLGAFSAKANQALGGEIGWHCDGNNNYIFEVAVFYDCSQTTSIPNAQLIQWDASIISISCSLVDSLSISPACSNATWAISCDTTMNYSPVKKYIYRSNPMSLAATIPATGWTFSTVIANRFATANTVGTNNNFVLRAKMYPYTINGNKVPATQCYDNAPNFSEKPRYAFSTDVNVFWIGGIDNDKTDSLSYRFAPSLTGSLANTDTIDYAPSFGYNKPLPDTLANSNNIEMMLSSNGQAVFKTQNVGRYTNCFKIESWRDGQKIAEVFQDFEMQINNDVFITGICGGPINLTPNITLSSYPNYTPINQWPGGATVEVFAGDSVKFKITSTDFDLTPNCQPQMITLGATGSMLNSGGQSCTAAPCANLQSLNVGGSFTSSLESKADFFWITDTAHVDAKLGRTVYWVYISGEDSHCTLTGRNEMAIKLIVKKPISAQQSQLSLCNGDTATTTILGDTTNLSWSPTTNISCTTCASPKFYPTVTTKYAVTDLNTGYVSYVNVDASQITNPPNIVPGAMGILLTNAADFDTVVYTRNSAPFFPNPSTSYAPILSGDYAVIGKVGVCAENSDTMRFDLNNDLEANSGQLGEYAQMVHQSSTYGATFRLEKEAYYNVNGIYVSAFANNLSPTALDNMECKIYDGGPTNVVFNSDSVVRISDDIIKFYGNVNLAANHDYLIGIYADTNVNVPLYKPTKWPIIAADERVYVFNATEKFGNTYPNVSASTYPYFHFSLGNGIGQEEFDFNQVNVYPNPAANFLLVDGVESAKYTLVNSIGQIVGKGDISGQTRIETGHVVVGTYVLKITWANGQTVQRKVLLMK